MSLFVNKTVDVESLLLSAANVVHGCLNVGDDNLLGFALHCC